jgi:hypothetical protein
MSEQYWFCLDKNVLAQVDPHLQHWYLVYAWSTWYMDGVLWSSILDMYALKWEENTFNLIQEKTASRNYESTIL